MKPAFMILWRFLSFQVWRWQLVVLAVFGFLAALQEYLQKSRMVSQWSAHWFSYWFWLTPEMIYWGLPIASLVAVLVVWQVLNRHREIWGLWCIGVSFQSLTLGIGFLGLLNGILLGALDLKVLSKSYVKRHVIYFEKLRQTPALFSVGSDSSRFYFKIDPYLFYVEKGPVWWKAQVILWDEESNQLRQILWSDRVTYKDGVLMFQQAQMVLIEPDLREPLWKEGIERSWTLPPDVFQVLATPKTLSVLNWMQLWDVAIKGQSLGFNVTPFWADFWYRLSYFLSPLTLMWVATWVSLAASLRRQISFWGPAGVVLVISVVFWVGLSLGKSWSLAQPQLAPLALVLPHSLTLALSWGWVRFQGLV